MKRVLVMIMAALLAAVLAPVGPAAAQGGGGDMRVFRSNMVTGARDGSMLVFGQLIRPVE